MKYDLYAPRHLLMRPYIIAMGSIPIILPICKYKLACGLFLFSISAILFLSTYWNLRSELIQCFVRNKEGSHIMFGNKILPLTKEKKYNGLPCSSFVFQHRKHLLISTKIVPLIPKLEWSFKELVSSTKHEMIEYYPMNDLRVPNPSFLRLFKEQCLSPLFCFQVFSSLFMCFDEHVWMGIFSTVMIFVVEASLIASRMITLRTFKTLETKDTTVSVISQKEFNDVVEGIKEIPETKEVSSKTLKPGDIVVFSELAVLPCDFVIIHGSCVVSEAMLSGESTPLIKESISRDEKTLFDVAKHKKHVLYGRSDLEKVISSKVYGRVIRTGFETEQGTLLSKMISAEDIKYDVEALRFILILTFIGLINSIFTFFYSKKSGYPLLVDIIVLFTSSIPFELPMEMSVVVNSLVKKLSTRNIFCLEPFRINLAGKIDVCCFDKTGTLTDSNIEMKSIEKATSQTDVVLGCCNDLISINGKVKGDPIDIAIREWIKKEGKAILQYEIIKRFPFSSEKRQQSLIARVKVGNGATKTYYMTKGAPEVIKECLGKIPSDYDNYKEYASNGYRVLAIASREAEDCKEGCLEFNGFILFGASLRKDAAETCKILRESNHKIVMITGDNLLTAKCVAKQLGISQEGVEGGDEIERIVTRNDEAFEKIGIFARAEPRHKEMIIKNYNKMGYHTMMVGDGTNDVGALKAASVGVAMLESGGPVNNSTKEIQVKPGDASAAAPFTVRSNSLLSIVDIIQYGRSSLVTTIQMYKILALSSVSSAFSLLFLDILGVKFSEAQMLSTGLFSSLCFSAIYSSKPLTFISKERPVSTIFSKYILFSICGQTLANICGNYFLYSYIPHPPVNDKFSPSLMNSVLFAVGCCSIIVTFVSNYIGRPFREDLVENKFMVISILGLALFGLNAIFGFHSDLNALLEIVDISEYRTLLLVLIVCEFLCCYLIEKICFCLFIKDKNRKNQ